MKSLGRILSLIVVASAATLLMNCDSGGSDEKSVEEVQLDKLKGNWAMSSVELDGTDRSSDFTNFVLNLSGTYSNSTNPTYNFSVSGSRPNPSPWPATGTWRFGDNPETTILRLVENPPLSISYQQNGSQLSMSFTFTGAGYAGGRVGEVEGNWEFVFTKQ